MRMCLVLLLSMAVTGCSTDPENGVTVTISVRRGPIAPVAQPGEDNTAPVGDAEVRILRDEARIELKYTGSTGLAEVVLEPGSYVARVTVCPGSLALPEPQPFTAAAGADNRVTLVCDTGIR